mmetsp:Transcript_28915/g.49285  ORF Transcript_28915/g.49285 Transcript_28915/m.49285 type:complete len:113 (-) Transcript_28915:505-843(-)
MDNAKPGLVDNDSRGQLEAVRNEEPETFRGKEKYLVHPAQNEVIPSSFVCRLISVLLCFAGNLFVKSYFRNTLFSLLRDRIIEGIGGRAYRDNNGNSVSLQENIAKTTNDSS